MFEKICHFQAESAAVSCAMAGVTVDSTILLLSRCSRLWLVSVFQIAFTKGLNIVKPIFGFYNIMLIHEISLFYAHLHCQPAL